MYLRHFLLKNRILTRLTDDQIGPLDDDNADKKCSMTSVLQHFALSVILQHSKHTTRAFQMFSIPALIISIHVFKQPREMIKFQWRTSKDGATFLILSLHFPYSIHDGKCTI